MAQPWTQFCKSNYKHSDTRVRSNDYLLNLSTRKRGSLMVYGFAIHSPNIATPPSKEHWLSGNYLPNLSTRKLGSLMVYRFAIYSITMVRPKQDGTPWSPARPHLAHVCMEWLLRLVLPRFGSARLRSALTGLGKVTAREPSGARSEWLESRLAPKLGKQQKSSVVFWVNHRTSHIFAQRNKNGVKPILASQKKNLHFYWPCFEIVIWNIKTWQVVVWTWPHCHTIFDHWCLYACYTWYYIVFRS